MRDKELCMERIRILQEIKNDCRDRINPLLADSSGATQSLYVGLNQLINEVIWQEAKYLVKSW